MRLKVQLVLLLLALTPLQLMAEDDSTIVILGDSLSAAYGMEIGEAWPSLLQGRLEESGYVYRVFNSSIAGDTTQGGLARLPRLLENQQPSIVIIELGGNDGLRGLPLEVTRSNLASMIEQSQAAGARVVLAEMRIPPNYGRTYTEKFHGNYADLAQQYDAELLPFLLQDIALEAGMMQKDGIHPTAGAQPLILDQVWQVIEPLLQGSASVQ